ncbi:MAG: hypothetical protein ABI267_10660 [Ginsengibacter sp.]
MSGKKIAYNGGMISEPFTMEKNSAKGMYEIEITTRLNETKTIKIIYQ